MNDWDAKRAIMAKVDEVIALARNIFPRYTTPSPTVSFDLRGRSCGGTATGYRAMQFNLDWYKADPDAYLSIVVPHEVAHIVTKAIYPNASAHGREWKTICLRLGGDGKRTCSLPSTAANGPVRSARRVSEYRYMSDSGIEVWVGPVHHRKLQERGDMRNPVTQRPYYCLTSRTAGRIQKTGFTGQSRKRP